MSWGYLRCQPSRNSPPLGGVGSGLGCCSGWLRSRAKLPAAMLRHLAALRWFDAGESLILYGPVGVGKTHVTQALGHQVARRGGDIRFVGQLGGRPRWRPRRPHHRSTHARMVGRPSFASEAQTPIGKLFAKDPYGFRSYAVDLKQIVSCHVRELIESGDAINRQFARRNFAHPAWKLTRLAHE